MSESYNILLAKLRRFTRKYYLNQLLRGALLFLGVFALFFLLVNAFEYYTWSNPLVRTVLFYAYVLINIFILVRLIIIPLLKMFRLGKTIGEEEAARIIGAHFPDVADRLINTIQLKKLSEENGTLELLEAGIEQKTRSLRPVPFVRAVDLGANRKYLKYTIPPLLALLVLFLASPTSITEPSKRILQHRTAFEKPVPFTIRILNESLDVMQYDGIRLQIAIEGEQLPAHVYFSANGNLVPFKARSATQYVYSLNKLQNDVNFNIVAEDYVFGPYTIHVLPRALITNYEVALDYPDYTAKKDETLENNGNFVIPEGTFAEWKVITRDTREVTFRFPDELIRLNAQGSNAFVYKKRLMEGLAYSISASNEYQLNPDSLSHTITVIKDIYPTAIFEEFRDSVYEKRLYFRGQISDDYGFSGLTFNYEFLNNFDSARVEGKVLSEEVAYSSSTIKQIVFHHFDMAKLNIGPGDEVQYYFEVWDNDEVNGYKSSRSHKMIFRAPGLEEISELADANNEELKDDMEDMIHESQMLQEQIEKLNMQLINKETLSWQDKEQVRNLLNQQQQLQERMDLLREKHEENIIREQQYKEQNEDILRKQEELQELFEAIMDDEMKALFEELQKMLDELNKDGVQQMLEKMEMSAEDIEENLDRNLELFKQLEYDKKLTEAIDQIEKLAKEQQELANKSLEKNADKEGVAEEQQKLNEEFAKAREELKQLDELNMELENPNPPLKTGEKEEETSKEMENSLEKAMDGKMKKASESQQKSAEEMEELAEMLSQMQMQMQSDSNAEDIAVIREMLENLIIISFDQEDLIEKVNEVSYADPRYLKLVEEQYEIRDNMKMIEDSLYALSKRQAMVKPFISKEVEKVNENLEDAGNHLQERKKGNAVVSQQYAMTSMNNLALFLSEALQQMQQNMNMPGNSSCDNAGGSSAGQTPKNMGELQKQLNQQMQRMKDGMEKGGKEGQKGSKGSSGMSQSEEFARMAAEQEAIRRQMQQYLEELKSSGEAGDGGMSKLMEEMEKTEQDLVNKRITDETMQRQEEIYTRLLKHEKAQREREKEERRESREAKSQDYSNPENFLEYKRILSKEVELLKTVPPNLKPFYKRKVNEYFYNFGN